MKQNQSFHSRLSSDQAALQASLPPHYLAPNGSVDGHGIVQGDLRGNKKAKAMTLLIAGGQETPYADGLWRLEMHITSEYPRIPPIIIFRDQIWHPNVDEQSGVMCSDTLARDWDEKCTLKDALNIVSRLLYHPNAASISNPLAGELFRGDYDAFAHQAQAMTSRYAAIPSHMKKPVLQAQTSGQQNASGYRRTPVKKPITITRGYYHTRSMSMEIRLKDNHCQHSPLSLSVIQKPQPPVPQQQQQSVLHKQCLAASPSPEAENDENAIQDDGKENDDSAMEEDDDDDDDSKENEGPTASMPSSATRGASSSTRRPILGTKRPLSVLTTNNSDDEGDMILIGNDDDHGDDEYGYDDDDDDFNHNMNNSNNELSDGHHKADNRARRLRMSDSERNIAANRSHRGRDNPDIHTSRSVHHHHQQQRQQPESPFAARVRKHPRLQFQPRTSRPFTSSSIAAAQQQQPPSSPITTSLPSLQIYEDPQSPSMPTSTSFPATSHHHHHQQEQEQEQEQDLDLPPLPLPDRSPSLSPSPETPPLGTFVFKSQSANPSSSPSKYSGQSSLPPLPSPHRSKVTPSLASATPSKASPRKSKSFSSPQKPRIGLRRL